MAKFILHCQSCDSYFKTSKIVPGVLLLCPQCDAALTVPEQVTLFCKHCNLESEPIYLALDEKIQCPQCDETMTVIREDLPNNIDLDSLPEIVSPDTQEEPDISDVAKDFNETIPVMSPVSSDMERREDISDSGSRKNTTIALSDSQISTMAENYQQKAGLISKGTFGKYKIVREIARGGMGIVYQVYDPDIRRDMALKVLIEGEGATKETIKRFLREARAAGNLHHPNIIAVHEMGELEGQYYFTMDYIIGMTFEDIINSGKLLPVEKFLGYMIKVCDALNIAHENGIIHRDLKPGNIMLEEKTDNVVLMDFGLAKDTTSMSIQSMTGSIFGSPAYMSPEQAQGKVHEIDVRSDIFSLGIILYEGLTGEQPFQGNTVYEIMINIVKAEPPLPRKLKPDRVSKDMENIILQSLEKEPSRRYQTVKALQDDLQAYLAGDTVSARPVPSFVRLWRKAKRKPAALAALISLPLIIITLLLGKIIFYRPSIVEIAKEAVQSGNSLRVQGIFTDIIARYRAGKIKSEDTIAELKRIFRQCADESDEECALLALDGLRELLDKQSVPLFLRIAENKKNSEKRRIKALNTIRSISSKLNLRDSGLSARLANIVSDKENSIPVRKSAISALTIVYGPSCIKTLLAIATSKGENTKIRISAINGLAAHLRLESPSMQKLLALYGDENPEVAEAAAKALAKARSKSSIFDFYGIGGINKSLIAKTFEKVGKLKQQQMAYNKRIMELVNDTPGAPKPAKKKKPIDIIRDKLEHGDENARTAAAYDLGELNNPEALPALIRHLSDPVQSVRKICAKSILKLSKIKKPNLKPIRELLDNKKMLIRELAVFILGNLNDMNSFPKFLYMAKHDKSVRVQKMIAKILKNYDDKRSIEALSIIIRNNYDKSFSTVKTALQSIQIFEANAAPVLINLLSIDNTRLKKSVIAVLRELTGEDFGDNITKWQQWLNSTQEE